MHVYITGRGIISPLACAAQAFDEALFSAKCAISAHTLELPGQPEAPIAIATSAFVENSIIAPSKTPLDRGSAMAIACAEQAVQDSGIDWTGLDKRRVGIYWGSGMASAASFDATCRALYADHKRLRPSTVVTTMPNAAASELALRYGVRGMVITQACACASAAVALGEAMLAIRAGRIDVAIAGGSEALLSTGVLGAWQAMRVMAPPQANAERICRPFAQDRNSFALGEGGAAFILEAADWSRARRAKTYAQLSGYAVNCDAFHITQPQALSQAEAMHAALQTRSLIHKMWVMSTRMALPL